MKRSTESKLSVSETFYSLQGEGKTTGRPAVFLRLSGCNLLCGGKGTQHDKQLHNGATWRCDTIEVWIKGTRKRFSEVFNASEKLALSKGAHLIITGGEPLLHRNVLADFIPYMKGQYPSLFIEMETNGTLLPMEGIDQYNVSPKLSNSGNPWPAMHKHEVLRAFNQLEATQFKFVISRAKDWEEIQEYYLPYIDPKKVWLMPAGDSQ